MMLHFIIKRGSIYLMKRTQIQLDEEVYELLKHWAFKEKIKTS